MGSPALSDAGFFSIVLAIGAIGIISIIGISGLAIVGVYLFGASARRKKRARLSAFAAGIGWTYQEDASYLRGRWRGDPFRAVPSQRFEHLVRGPFRGRPAAAFEYQYTTGSGEDRSTVLCTVTMLSLPAALPDVELTWEGPGAALVKALGGQDIQFESEAFNRCWRVEGAVLRTAHDVVHPRFMEFMLAGPPDPLRFEGANVWTWHGGHLDPPALEARFERLSHAADLVPRHVWQDYGYDPAAPTRS